MTSKFQQLVKSLLENFNVAGAGGVFGSANVYGDPEAFDKESTKNVMAVAGKSSVSGPSKKKKKVKKKKTPIIRRTFPEKIWN